MVLFKFVMPNFNQKKTDKKIIIWFFFHDKNWTSVSLWKNIAPPPPHGHTPLIWIKANNYLYITLVNAVIWL
jgi:hypothetical protein